MDVMKWIFYAVSAIFVLEIIVLVIALFSKLGIELAKTLGWF